MATNSLGTKGADIIKKSEGFSLKFYGDPKGYPTVGWGHLITKSKVYTKNKTGDPKDSLLTQKEADALSKSLGLDYTSPITQKKADAFFTSDTKSAVDAVNNLTLPSGSSFSQEQFDALVSLTFNAGSGVLKTNDVVTMLKDPKIYPTYTKKLSTTESDNCSKLVSKAFSYDKNLKTRRDKEATLFCTDMKYTHKYPVYSL
ncbi:lysozyme [Lacrimispora xylanolytica]|jgi:GH24 family phage-related lysozyme (muramidase)|uniref:Lysozyme n=1 Tax=Lacrimispora xylanolytica TaxID=29375 RepID=A0ABY7AF22_9FIRM|nr:lysozyme [Lacrimispora xylanolytica]MBS5958329.1 lysozyme [Clostridiales bacterium]WAJ25310.1 lysozyme [Lacrimispora xylanolytica]